MLAVGLAILAAAAWRLSEAVKLDPARTSATSTHPTSTSGSEAAGLTAGQPSRSGTATSGDQSQSGRAGSQGGQAAPESSSAPSPTASGLGGLTPPACSSRSIVLSMSADQIRFAPGQEPVFSLSVVSTQPTACSFDLGAGHLAVVIKKRTTRIWSSADCAGGSRSIVTTLTRGIPTVVSIGWHRKMSAHGCSGHARAAAAGTYTAYAVDGSLVSAPVTLRLS